MPVWNGDTTARLQLSTKYQILSTTVPIPPRNQKCPDKRFQVAIQHAVHVSNLHFCAMVLDQSVGMQYVRAYLRAEIDVQLGIFQLLADGALFLQLKFVKFGAQHLHGTLTVLVL